MRTSKIETCDVSAVFSHFPKTKESDRICRWKLTKEELFVKTRSMLRLDWLVHGHHCSSKAEWKSSSTMWRTINSRCSISGVAYIDPCKRRTKKGNQEFYSRTQSFRDGKIGLQWPHRCEQASPAQRVTALAASAGASLCSGLHGPDLFWNNPNLIFPPDDTCSTSCPGSHIAKST